MVVVVVVVKKLKVCLKKKTVKIIPKNGCNCRRESILNYTPPYNLRRY